MGVKHATDQSTQNSFLFMLRLWPENPGGGQTDWRGSLQHVNSGELRYFRDWPTLQAFVDGLLRRIDPQVSGVEQVDDSDNVQ